MIRSIGPDAAYTSSLSIARATRRPRSVPVASRIAMCAKFVDALVRIAMIDGRNAIAPKSTGPNTVATMNHFVRTRSRYSRLVVAQSLRMAIGPLLGARSAHLVEEDAMQRRLDELEPLHRRAAVDDRAQQALRVRARRELDLHRAIGVVHATHELRIVEHRRERMRGAVRKREGDEAAAVL